MINENLIIISRYKEDLSWINHLKSDIIIYNKDSNFPYDFPRTDIPNIGRESETYVRSIVENYELLDKYKYFTFLQGHPFDHCPNLFKDILENTDTYLGLTKSFTTHNVSLDLNIFNNSILIFEKLIDICKTIYDLEVNDVLSGKKHSAKNELEELMYVMYFLNLPYTNFSVSWATGAQYKISTKMLKNKSKEWWKNLHLFIIYCYEKLNWIQLGYALERIWPLIWKYDESSKCYC